MRYRILNGHEELAVVTAASSKDAIEEYVDGEFSDAYSVSGWKTRDFLKYSLRVERIPSVRETMKRHQFTIRDLIWLMLIVGFTAAIFAYK